MKKLNQILLLWIAVSSNIFSQYDIADRIDAYGKLQSGAYKEAIRAFTGIDSGNKLSPKDRLSLGIAQFRIGNLSDARHNFQSSNEAGIAEANIWLARTYALNRNINDAILFIERYLKTSKNPDIAGIQKDSSFRFMHESEKWFDLWQNDWYSENQKIEQEAMFYAGRKKYNIAHKIIESKVIEDISKADLYLCNAHIYLAEENPSLALNEINQAVKLDPSNAFFLKEHAKCNSLLNEYSSALEDLNQAITIDPTDFETRLQRADAAFRAENYEMASNDIELYLNYFSSEEAQFLAGQISFASGDYLNALRYYNRLMKDAKPNASYFKARGLTYYQTGTYSPASSDLSMSLDLEPGDGETNLYLGLAEYYKGNNKAACYYWNRAKYSGELKAIEYIQKYCK
jgi:tetratricopeptide (TPR) repeat protein